MEEYIPKTLKKQTVKEDVFAMALDRVRHCFRIADHVSVFFSGGKDSSVILNLALQVAREMKRLPLEVIFWDEEAIPLQTAEYVDRVRQLPDVRLRWLCIPIQHVNACSPKSSSWYPWHPQQRDLWVRPMPDNPNVETSLPGFRDGMTIPDAAHLLAKPGKINVQLLGIRADESLRRLMACCRKETDNYITEVIKDGYVLKLAYPIYDWMTEDVWLAPKLHGWDYNCNPYEAPIWMADYTFKPIGEIEAGDMVIGWERGQEPARLRGGPKYTKDRLVKTEVLAVHRRISQLVKVTMDSGAVIRCTPDHLWLTVNGNRNKYEYNKPLTGLDLCRVVDLPESQNIDKRLAGWLGGIYDGEGCGDRIYQSPIHNQNVYRKIEASLIACGVPFSKLNGRSAAQHGFRITGGRSGLVKFLNIAKPVRRGRHVDSVVLGSKFRRPDKIVSIEPAGEAEVYALTTATGNYVCWGYASKNSAYDLMEAGGMMRRDQRVAPPFGEQPLCNLWMYSVLFPEVWGKMSRRVPGAATAARYSRSVLYSFKDMEKPEDVTWKEMVTLYLYRWPPEQRVFIADRLERNIAQHLMISKGEPIQEEKRHHITGISWKYLAAIACRGDLKNRKRTQRAKTEIYNEHARNKKGGWFDDVFRSP